MLKHTSGKTGGGCGTEAGALSRWNTRRVPKTRCQEHAERGILLETGQSGSAGVLGTVENMLKSGDAVLKMPLESH